MHGRMRMAVHVELFSESTKGSGSVLRGVPAWGPHVARIANKKGPAHCTCSRQCLFHRCLSKSEPYKQTHGQSLDDLHLDAVLRSATPRFGHGSERCPRFAWSMPAALPCSCVGRSPLLGRFQCLCCSRCFLRSWPLVGRSLPWSVASSLPQSPPLLEYLRSCLACSLPFLRLGCLGYFAELGCMLHWLYRGAGPIGCLMPRLGLLRLGASSCRMLVAFVAFVGSHGRGWRQLPLPCRS